MLPIALKSCAKTAQNLGLDFFPVNPRFSIALACPPELSGLASMAGARIPDLQGTYRAMKRVQEHSQSIVAIKTNHCLVGGFAALLLNDRGYVHLLDGSLSVAEPSCADLAPAGEQAAAIYVWALCGLKTVVGAAGNVMEWLTQVNRAKVNIYARPGTPKGKTFMIRAGFRPLGSGANSLWIYERRIA